MTKTALSICSPITFDALSNLFDVGHKKTIGPVGGKIVIGSFELIFVGIMSDRLPYHGFNGLKTIRPHMSGASDFTVKFVKSSPILETECVVYATMHNNVIKINLLCLKTDAMMLTCSINVSDIPKRFPYYWTSKSSTYTQGLDAYYEFKENFTYKSNIKQTYKCQHLLRAENYQKFQYIVENYPYKIDITNVNFSKMHVWLTERYGNSPEFYIMKNTLYLKSEADAVLFKLEI